MALARREVLHHLYRFSLLLVDKVDLLEVPPLLEVLVVEDQEAVLTLLVDKVEQADRARRAPMVEVVMRPEVSVPAHHLRA